MFELWHGEKRCMNMNGKIPQNFPFFPMFEEIERIIKNKEL